LVLEPVAEDAEAVADGAEAAPVVPTEAVELEVDDLLVLPPHPVMPDTNSAANGSMRIAFAFMMPPSPR